MKIMANAVIFVIVIIAFISGIKSTAMRIENGCCGGKEADKRKKVRDRDKSHYSYRAEIRIDGMKCRNCQIKVENALNSLDGVWAEADAGKKCATVLTKTKMNSERLAAPVCAAGYTVIDVTWI